MIAKGTPHNNGAKLAAYLTTGKAGESATLWELRGFASDDIRQAFRSVHVMAEGTRAEQPFFHVQVRNPDNESLTRAQWERVADRIESKLGLSDQARAITFHMNEGTGHEHMHVAWSRIDGETMTARALPFYKLRLKEVCRELETELGLKQVTSERRGPTMAPKRAEYEQSRRLGVDIHDVRATIRDCWERSDNARSFVAALAEKGLTLATGDRRDYIVVDHAGGMHALGKRILGNSAQEVRDRLAGVELCILPTVEQVRAELAGAAVSPVPRDASVGSVVEIRDTKAMLELITRQRATFTERDVEWVARKEIQDDTERKQFVARILEHGSVVHLSSPRGSAARYTTNEVLESERRVLRAAHDLSRSNRHAVAEEIRSDVLNGARFDGISREQVRAVRHATGPEALALIDGQAGTGKSYTMTAIRATYEVKGCTVVGLAPTNAVAQEMKDNGFAHARTAHSELYALENGRARWNSHTVVILDEAAMIDTRNMIRLTEQARIFGAKLILIGDDRQLSSIERGGMFSVLKERHGSAELTEVRRQQSEDDRRAAKLMAKGNFTAALARYTEKGGIRWSRTQSEAADALVRQWAKDTASEPSKSRFVFAYTNEEVSELNNALREVKRARGDLGDSSSFETKHGRANFAPGDRVQFTDTDKRRGIYNGQAGTIMRIEGSILTVGLDGSRAREVKVDTENFQGFRHGYAGTIYRGQGRTIDQTYLFHSEYWRASASYVALTRHREKAELFVSRDTASDMKELAFQMARVDDRRAASHFERPSFDLVADELLKPTDWRRILTDPDYRRSIDQQHLSGQARSAFERYGGGWER